MWCSLVRGLGPERRGRTGNAVIIHQPALLADRIKRLARRESLYKAGRFVAHPPAELWHDSG